MLPFRITTTTLVALVLPFIYSVYHLLEQNNIRAGPITSLFFTTYPAATARSYSYLEPATPVVTTTVTVPNNDEDDNFDDDYYYSAQYVESLDEPSEQVDGNDSSLLRAPTTSITGKSTKTSRKKAYLIPGFHLDIIKKVIRGTRFKVIEVSETSKNLKPGETPQKLAVRLGFYKKLPIVIAEQRVGSRSEDYLFIGIWFCAIWISSYIVHDSITKFVRLLLFAGHNALPFI